MKTCIVLGLRLDIFFFLLHFNFSNFLVNDFFRLDSYLFTRLKVIKLHNLGVK